MTVVDPGFDYYVDATGGNDSNGGQSSVDAWKTIAKVNSSMPNGSSVGFKYGEEWAVEGAAGYLAINAASESVGAYGEDTLQKPTFRNSRAAATSGWTQDGTNVRTWSLLLATIDTPRRVWHNNRALASKGSVAALIPGSYYWDAAGTTLHVWLWNGKEPSTDDAVFVTEAAYAILGSGSSTSFSNLRFRHGDSAGLYINGAGATVDNCEFYNNAIGVRLDGNTGTVQYCTFVDNWLGDTYSAQSGYKEAAGGAALSVGAVDDCTCKNSVFVGNYLDYTNAGNPKRFLFAGNLSLYPTLTCVNYGAGGAYAGHTAGDQNVFRRNVILCDPNRYAYGTKNGHGIVWQSQTDWMRVERNVVVLDYQGSGGPTGCSINTGAFTADNSLADYNCYYKTGSSGGDLFSKDSGSVSDTISGHQTNAAAENISGIASAGSPEGASVVEDPGINGSYLPVGTSVYDGSSEWFGNATNAPAVPAAPRAASPNLSQNLFDAGDFTANGNTYTNDGGWFWDQEGVAAASNGFLFFEKTNGASYWSHAGLPALEAGKNYRIRFRIIPQTITSETGASWRFANSDESKWIPDSWQIHQYGEDVDITVSPSEDITLAHFWGADGYDAFQIQGMSIVETTSGTDVANVNQSWRGAVEPAESGATGNEVQLWRGAVEPAAPVSSTSDALIGGVTRSVTRSLTRGVTEGWSWGA